MEKIIKAIMMYFYIIIFGLMGCFLCIDKGWYPLGVVFFLIASFFIVSSGFMFRKAFNAAWEQRRAYSKKLTQIEKEYNALCRFITKQEDHKKPVVKNVRPGSRPSEAYYVLKGEKVNDSRSEDISHEDETKSIKT